MCAHGGKSLNKKGNILGRTKKHTDSHLLALRVSLYKKWEITDGPKPLSQLSRVLRFIINCESSGLGRRALGEVKWNT